MGFDSLSGICLVKASLKRFVFRPSLERRPRFEAVACPGRRLVQVTRPLAELRATAAQRRDVRNLRSL